MKSGNSEKDEIISPAVNDALIVVDMQYDFLPGGALPVNAGNSILSGINDVMGKFHEWDLTIVLTQDWHPLGHDSFASSHESRYPFDPFEAPGIGPVLWPDHCIQGTPGADFHKELKTDFAHAVIRKGVHRNVDSYSGFVENDRKTGTGLDGYLRSRGVSRVFICGLALDYCVFYTAIDAAARGFDAYLLTDLTKPVGDPDEVVPNVLTRLESAGVRFLRSDQLELDISLT